MLKFKPCLQCSHFWHRTGDFHSVNDVDFLKFGTRVWKFSRGEHLCIYSVDLDKANLPCRAVPRRAQNVTV